MSELAGNDARRRTIAFARSRPRKPEFGLVHATLPCQIDVAEDAEDPANAFDPKPLVLDIAAALGT